MVHLTRSSQRISPGNIGNNHSASSEGKGGSVKDEYAVCMSASHRDELTLDANLFIVEAIKGHLVKDGCPRFWVKWQGFDKKKDMTWEPEQNLENCSVLEDYYKQIGGRDNLFRGPKRATQGRKRRKRSSAIPKSQKEARQQSLNTDVAGTDWTPPSGSWDNEEVSIDACDNAGAGKLVVYLIWKNGRKTKHDASVIYQKCPQKMLLFYEKHVSFTGAGA